MLCLFGVSELKSGKVELNIVLVFVVEFVLVVVVLSEVLVKKKFSYKLQCELEVLFGQIDVVEVELVGVQEIIVEQDFYLCLQDEQCEILVWLDVLQQEFDVLFECWVELED